MQPRENHPRPAVDAADQDPEADRDEKIIMKQNEVTAQFYLSCKLMSSKWKLENCVKKLSYYLHKCLKFMAISSLKTSMSCGWTN